MSPAEWFFVGTVIWALLVGAILVANYRFWNFIEPAPTCTGCQRHFIRADCPVHAEVAR